MKFILMDIEGTITDIKFVANILFPYAFEKMESYFQANLEQKSFQDWFDRLREDQSNQSLGPSEAVSLLRQWIKEDRKHPLLKEIQGHIWKEGYESGEIKGHLYPDVLPKWKKWKESGLILGIYSSGSVLAQKLLFENSVEGNVTSYLSHHFDTKVGAKREAQSYKNILAEINVAANDVLFLSDIEEECEAATQAGMNTQLVSRDSKALESAFPQIQTLTEIIFDT